MTQFTFNNKPVARYDGFLNDFLNFPSSWSAPSPKFRGLPPANIQETKDSYLLELNVPGRNREDFKVNIDKDLLTISFEKSEENAAEGVSSIRREFSFNSFKRSFSLDEKIDTSNIQAKYENGILKIELPKKEHVKAEPKQIAVS